MPEITKTIIPIDKDGKELAFVETMVPYTYKRTWIDGHTGKKLGVEVLSVSSLFKFIHEHKIPRQKLMLNENGPKYLARIIPDNWGGACKEIEHV